MAIGAPLDSTLTTILIIIHLIICAWIYIDAQDRDQVGVMWAVISFLLPLIGLAIYLLCFHTGEGKSHKAVNRNDEFGLRASHRQDLIPQSNDPPAARKEFPQGDGVLADPMFSDEELDRLIDESRFRSARRYLKEMTDMAKEMGDAYMLANYEQYNIRIYRAETGNAPGTSSSSRYGIP